MEKFQIKNPPVFFVGIIILIVGIFIVIFDYPQIQYFENLESKTFLLLEPEKQSIYERLKIEFSIGITLLVIGISLSIISLVKKSIK